MELTDSRPSYSSAAPSLKANSTYWTPRRAELHAWMSRQALSLAELYEGAVRLIYDNPLPGRVRFVSHAVREIRNRLPEIISGVRAGGGLQYKNRLDEIVKTWRDAGSSPDGALTESYLSNESVPSSPDSTLPRRLFLQIATLIKDHESARTKPEDAAFLLFEALAPENQQARDTLRPVVSQWLQVTKWFLKKAHDSGRPDSYYDEEEFRRQFELFESTLGSLVWSFFVTTDELDEILEDTNS